MPTATLELFVEKKYLVVGFRPAPVWIEARGQWGTDADLPAGLYAFGREGRTIAGPQLVTVILEKDAASGVDLTPMLVAADWLRGNGWTVKPIGWCEYEMEQAKAV